MLASERMSISPVRVGHVLERDRTPWRLDLQVIQ